MLKCRKHDKYFFVIIALLCMSIAIFGVYDINRLQIAEGIVEGRSERYNEAERDNDENPEDVKYHEGIVFDCLLISSHFSTLLQNHSSLPSLFYNCPFREVPSRAPPLLKS